MEVDMEYVVVGLYKIVRVKEGTADSDDIVAA